MAIIYSPGQYSYLTTPPRTFATRDFNGVAFDVGISVAAAVPTNTYGGGFLPYMDPSVRVSVAGTYGGGFIPAFDPTVKAAVAQTYGGGFIPNFVPTVRASV